MQICRPDPYMNQRSYKTYSVATPRATHWRSATCEEYLCADFLYGFVTTLDLTTDFGVKYAEIIRNDKTRKSEEIRTNLHEVRFVFPPGTNCWRWQQHKVPVDRPPILIVRKGDWRGSLGLIRRHTSVEFWAEDFGEHQNNLAARFARG